MSDVAPLSLLVADDDDVAAEAVVRCLRKQSWPDPIAIAEDGRSALNILRGKHERKTITRPFLVLLDLNMPRMNGVGFLRELRADVHVRGSVVFVLSTSGSTVDRARAYREFVAGYMVKSTLGPNMIGLARFLAEYRAANVLP
jgi:CheY-like chemotaxis protein